MQLRKNPLTLAIFAAGVLTVSACGAQEAPKPAAQPAPAQAQAPLQLGSGDTAFTVNGVAISKAKFEFAVKQRTAAGQPDSPEMRNAVKDDLINRELIAQEAKKKGVEKQPDVAMQLDFAQQSVLVGAYLQEWVKANPPSDEELKKDYEKIKGQMGDTEYKARHILVKDEDEAKKLIKELDKKADFAELAKKHSLGPTGKSGGELEWFDQSQMVQPFAEAVAAMKPGTYSKEPVQTQFGWHIINLQETRTAEPPKLEDVKPQLTAMVQRQKLGERLAEMRDKAMVDLNEEVVQVKPREEAPAEVPKAEAPKVEGEKN